MELTVEDIARRLDELAIASLVEDKEQLDELSKATLGSYIKKAASKQYGIGVMSMHNKNNADDQHKAGKDEDAIKSLDASYSGTQKSISRNKNITKAVNRLTKEDISEERFPSLAKALFSNKLAD